MTNSRQPSLSRSFSTVRVSSFESRSEVSSCILGIGVDRSSSSGRFHISDSDELMMLCLSNLRFTRDSACESILPNNRSASFLILRVPADYIAAVLREERREFKQSLVQLSLLVYNTVHQLWFALILI